MAKMRPFRKTIIRSGGQRPTEHERVTCLVTASVENQILLDNQLVIFDLGHAGDFGIIEILDEVVQTMGLDEECTIVTTLADGLDANEVRHLNLDHPLESELTISVHLRDIQRLTDFWNMSEAEKIAVADVMKRRGNKLLNAYKYARAVQAYKFAIKYLRGSVSVLGTSQCPNETASLNSDAAHLLSLSYSNAALCFLRMACTNDVKEPDDMNKKPKALSESTRRLLRLCVSYCRKAIEVDPNYPKTWFRLAKAHAEAGEFDDAIEAGTRCLDLLDKQNATKLKAETFASLAQWRKANSDLDRAHLQKVHQAIRKAYEDTESWSDDDEYDGFPISVWSNSLADNMMSLHEELEAFGEKMPDPKSSRANRRLETIPDEDEHVD